MSLTDAVARKKKQPGKYFDGKGLYLLVTDKSKYWRHKYRFAGKEQTGSYGVFPEVSLCDARIARDDTRALLKSGKNPAHERKIEKLTRNFDSENTFYSIAEDWIKTSSVEWSAKHTQRVRNSLENDIYSKIGSLPVKDVTPIVLRAALNTIQSRGAYDLASRVRQRCSAIFNHAMALGACNVNPAESLKVVIKTPAQKHFAAIDAEELPGFIRDVENYPANQQTILAFRLLLLTLVRTRELTQATWDEINYEESIWHIPADRMKQNRPHYVPLSRQALEIVQRLHTFNGNRKWIFPGFVNPRKPMSDVTILRLIHRSGYKGRQTGHGFRTIGSTVLHESGDFLSDVIERQLSHEDKNETRAAYNRAEYMDQRRRLMQWWADYIDTSLLSG